MNRVVFLGGSRKISRLNDSIRKRLDEIVKRGMHILVGDANGADRAIQRQLADWEYADVIVFHVGKEPRNNEGGWPTNQVPTTPKARGFEFYAVKDRAMAAAADCGLMLWDGASRGTLANVETLVKESKPVAVYVGPERRFVSVTGAADLQRLSCGIESETTTDDGSGVAQTALELGSSARTRASKRRRTPT